jgi:membrane protease YdiL (CAAX protease family)
MPRVQTVPIDRMRIDAPAREARELVVFAVGCAVVAGAAAAATRRWPWPLAPNADFTASVWYVVGFKLAFMLGGALGWMRWRGYRLADVLGPWRPTVRAWTAIAIALVAGLAINLQHVGPIGRLLSTDVAWSRIALGFVLPLVAAAIPEELAFRVLLQTRLEKVGGRLFAIGISTALFALWHLPSRFLLASGVEGTAGDLGSIVRATALPVFAVGLVLAAIWDRWRSFPVVVALHFAIDLLPSLRHALGGRF